MMKRLYFFNLFMALFLGTTLWGQIPRIISYQGVLNDASGNPVSDGTYSITFTLYDELGSPGWSENLSVSVADGIFSVILGESTSFPDPFPSPAKLGITVGTDQELSPRTGLTTTPYSLIAAAAQNADSLEHMAASAYTLDNEVGSIILDNDGSGSGLDADLLDGQNSLFYRDAGNIVSGQLNVAYFSAFTDLADENRLDNDDDNDLLTRGLSDARYWGPGGNSGTNPGTHFLGTTDDKSLNFKVNNQRVIYFQPHTTSPIICGGYSGNIIVSPGGYGGTISGGGYSGQINQIWDFFGTIGGGAGNSVNADYGTVSGGYSNAATGNYATVAGGNDNTASGQESVVSGGNNNTASGAQATVGGGNYNSATQVYATVPGGIYNEATGQSSFAAGTNAHADDNYAVVIAATSDMTPTPTYAVYSGGAEQMVLRADGGLYITNAAGTAPYNTSRLINTSSGAYLTTAGVWTDNSDRESKENFTPVDRNEILKKIASLPITKWNFKIDNDDIKHIGPVAQDFHANFNLGDSDKNIATMDEAGIALVGIQELYKRSQLLEEQTQRISELEEEISDLKAQVQELRGLVQTSLTDHAETITTQGGVGGSR